MARHDMSGEKGRVLLTGASGFVGRHLGRALTLGGWQVRAALRRPSTRTPETGDCVVTGDIDGTTTWQAHLDSVQAVVHAAARAHVLDEQDPDPLAAFRKTNVEGTARLAQEAAAAGVSRFVFLSSIGARQAEYHANGQGPAPNAYQRSKYEAELRLREMEKNSGMAVTILRPPLIYGPDAPGNFARLVGVVQRGLPLPLASATARRAYLYVENLCDAILCCLAQPDRARGTFEVSDATALSTPELVRKIAVALGRPARLWPCPLWILRLGGRLTGRTAMIESLTGGLELDAAPLQERLNWSPPYDIHEGLAASLGASRAELPPDDRSPPRSQ